jgi:hypothetical protein
MDLKLVEFEKKLEKKLKLIRNIKSEYCYIFNHKTCGFGK